VSRSSVATVRNYVARQEEHHRKRSFQEEYLDLVKKHDTTSNSTSVSYGEARALSATPPGSVLTAIRNPVAARPSALATG
jgi:hypothetical protein